MNRITEINTVSRKFLCKFYLNAQKIKGIIFAAVKRKCLMLLEVPVQYSTYHLPATTFCLISSSNPRYMLLTALGVKTVSLL